MAGIYLGVNTLESRCYINEAGKFSSQPLPEYAQFSTLEKVIVADLTNDGIMDLIALGNDFGMDAETYQLDASDGYLFQGLGNGRFTETPVLIGNAGAARDAILMELANKSLVLVVANNDAAVRVFQVQK